MRLLHSISENLTTFEKSILIVLILSMGAGLSIKLIRGKSPQKQTLKVNKININTAGLEDLMQVPGIGLHTAELIIEYRQKHGPFRSIEELRNVKGIGKTKFSKIKDYITVQ